MNGYEPDPITKRVFATCIGIWGSVVALKWALEILSTMLPWLLLLSFIAGVGLAIRWWWIR